MKAHAITVSTLILLNAPGLFVFAASADSSSVSIVEFNVPTAASQPWHAAVGAGGEVWFTELAAKKLGRLDPVSGVFTEIPVTNRPRDLVCSLSDGKVLFTGDEYNSGHYGVWLPATGELREYSTGLPVASGVDCMLDPSGAFWFNGWDSRAVSRVSKTGMETFIPPSFGYMAGLADDSRGNLWLTIVGWAESSPRLLKLNTAAARAGTSSGFTEIPFPGGAATIRAPMAAGGKIWFAIQDRSQVGCYDPATGSFTNYPTPTPGAVPAVFAADRWGRIWFTERLASRIGMLDPRTGVITEFPTPTPNSGPEGIAVDLTRDVVWFTEANANKIGRLALKSDAGDYDPDPATPVHYVSLTGAHIPPFNSWTRAATNIQAAVDAATDGDAVIVADGTYLLSSSVVISKGIVVRGANSASTTVVDGRGAVRCFYLSHSNAVLDGLTITRGRSNRGGGVYCDLGGTVLRCILAGNTAAYVDWRDGGAAVFLYRGGCVDSCVIQGNSSAIHGAGALCLEGGVIRNSVISSNSTAYDGGGVYCWMGGSVNDCTITRNSSGGHAGGLYGWGASSERCAVSDNQAGGEGGGVHWVHGTLDRCTVRGNRGAWSGGGITAWYSTMRNCLVFDNVARDHGGGVEAVGSEVKNCTIARNRAAGAGGIAFEQNGSAINSIVWDNTASNGMNYAGVGTITYSCTAPLSPSNTGHNIASDPLFADAASNDCRLQAGSPCINAGLNEAWMTNAFDLDGSPRVLGAIVDMGAYESAAFPTPIHYVSLTGAHIPPFASWLNAATTIQAAVNAATDGDTVLVGAGTFDLASTIRVTNGIALRGVNGAAQTTVDGGGTKRCLVMSNRQAVAEGFTIQRGSASPENHGGGVLIASGGGVLRNCVVRDCRAYDGAGIGCGTNSVVEDCLIYSNRADAVGGGISCWSGGVVRRCRIEGNAAPGYRGGGVEALGALVEQCVVSNNSSCYGSGVHAAYGTRLLNCLIVGNRAVSGYGGGVDAPMTVSIQNCTIADNYAATAGGLGAGTQVEVRNSIICFNGARLSGTDIEGHPDMAYCCTPEPGSSNGAGNVTGDPLFVDRAAGNYRLRSGSPCIDSGTSSGALGVDLDGVPRPLDGDGNGAAAYDMGAYEFVYLGGGSNMPAGGGAADSDGDGMSDAEELAAGTDPTDPASVLSVTVESSGAPGEVVIRWPSVEGRTYTILRALDLMDGFSELTSGIAATPPENAYMDVLPDEEPRFYRVRVQP
jgi:streptogramin lyase